MKSLAEIQRQFATGNFVFSRHAFKRAVERNISETEIIAAGKTAVIIEEYISDKYTPSCLLLGFTDEKRPIHIQVSRADTPQTKIITLYEPNLMQWDESFTRRR